MSYIFSIISLFLILSCGKAVEDESETEAQEDLTIDGTYMAILVPVNGKLSAHIQGDVKISKYSDEFKVQIKVKNPPSGTLVQSIQTGTSCPKLESDKNLDGYLDSYESRESMGYTIVPLDGDLSSQREGSAFTLRGNYSYRKTASYYLMLSDLHLIDDVSNDAIVKLSSNDLPLERRVVAVYLRKHKLPPTIAGDDIPIACGVLTRVSVDENTSETDTWDTQNEDETYRRPPRPRPAPRPVPGPRPEPEIEPQPENNGSWWSRWRDRWNRWRSRWGGGSNDESEEDEP